MGTLSFFLSLLFTSNLYSLDFLRVAQAYLNQRKLDAEAKQLQSNVNQFSKSANQWLNLMQSLNKSVKVSFFCWLFIIYYFLFNFFKGIGWCWKLGKKYRKWLGFDIIGSRIHLQGGLFWFLIHRFVIFILRIEYQNISIQIPSNVIKK